MNNNKITGLADPTNDNNAVNMKYVNDKIHTQINTLFTNNANSYDLQPNFTFNGRAGGYPFHTGNGGIQQHYHGIWYRVTPKVFRWGLFRAYFSVHNNNLKPGKYTGVFEFFSLYNNTVINDFSTMIFGNSDSPNQNYKYIQLKSQSINNNHKKIIMQFEVFSNPGILNGELRFTRSYTYFSMFRVKFAFFHRIIEGLYDLDFDHGVFDADPQQLFFIDSLSLNNKRLTDVADPTDAKDSANKRYVDSEIAKLPHSDDGTLKLDGSRAMIRNLNMVIIISLTLKIQDQQTQIMQPLLISSIRQSVITIPL